jgi:phage anti-repressor protein
LGFSQKIRAKEIIEKNFKLDIDFKTAFSIEKAVLETSVKQNGGQNKQTIMLTIKCFKSLCLKAQTKKASEIHEYYIKLEETLHEIVEEETNELKLQLEQKDNIILEIKQSTEKEKIVLKKENQKALEQAIIIQFPLNTECIYFGTIDNTNETGEKLLKFGHTNDLGTRVLDHRKKYSNFILVNAYRVQNKVEIENLIKTYPKIKRQIRSIEVNGKNKTEIIAYDSTNFTIEKLNKTLIFKINSVNSLYLKTLSGG